MKFRLKQVEDIGWFAQVNLEENFYGEEKPLFDNWHTLGSNGVDFHPADDVSSPAPYKAQALALIKEFKSSFEPKHSKIEYFEVK